MLSRIASSLYWLGAYIERAENVARLVDVNLHLMLDLSVGATEQWEPLVWTTGDHELFQEHYSTGSQENVMRFLTFDSRNPNSVFSTLTQARDNARSVRDTMSGEIWEQINRAYLFVRDAADENSALETPHDFYNEVKLLCNLVSGVTDTTQSRGEAWHFLNIGRLLERADKTSRIIDLKYYIVLPTLDDVGTPFDKLHWAALLKSASALEMYRKRFGRISLREAVEFLVMNRTFPRAIHYCLMRAEESLHEVVGSSPGTYRDPAQRLIGQLRATLNYIQIDEIIQFGLHEWLDNFQTQLNEAGAAISRLFFDGRADAEETGETGETDQERQAVEHALA